MMEVFAPATRFTNFPRLLYEHNFPDWFVVHASSHYQLNWDGILMTLRNGRFFFPDTGYFGSPIDNITGKYLDKADGQRLGETSIHRLAALATTLPNGDSVANSLQFDGYVVNQQKLSLVPLENVVSAQEEGDALTASVKRTGIPNAQTVLQHIADAKNLFVPSTAWRTSACWTQLCRPLLGISLMLGKSTPEKALTQPGSEGLTL